MKTPVLIQDLFDAAEVVLDANCRVLDPEHRTMFGHNFLVLDGGDTFIDLSAPVHSYDEATGQALVWAYDGVGALAQRDYALHFMTTVPVKVPR